MGLHDAEEMLEAAKTDVLQLEREVAKLRAVIARVADYARDESEEAAKWEQQGERAEIVRGDVARAVLGIVDDAADPKADLSPLSTLSVNGKRLTWQEVAADRETRLLALEPVLTMLADLDRNRNGRHEDDIDMGQLSLGNPHLATGQVIGYSLHGTHVYVVPPARERHDPAAWKHRRQ